MGCQHPAQPQHCQPHCHTQDPTVLWTPSRWTQGEGVIKNKKKTKKVLVSNCLLLTDNSGHPQVLRRLQEQQHTKSPSPLQCASCVYLLICVSKTIMSKLTASFRFQGRERKWVLAARKGRSRGSSLLCCCLSGTTLLSAVKLPCPGRTDYKVRLVNLEQMFIWSFILVL